MPHAEQDPTDHADPSAPVDSSATVEHDDDHSADPADHADDLRLALAIADDVDRLTSARFGAVDLVVEAKPDLTPVTDADRAAEALVREHLTRERPDDAVLGEEEGATAGRDPSGGRRWVVDPIDGTKNFVRGVPVWATLIALLAEVPGFPDPVPVVGVVSAPALGRRWWAARGAGAWVAGAGAAAGSTAPRRLRVSSVGALGDASLSSSELVEWETAGLLEPFLGLTREVWRSRAYGDFYSYALLAEGALDIACEPELALHDMAALVPVVTEAGGRFTDLDGEDGPFGGSALVTNGLLHAEVLARLGGTTAGG